MCGLGRLYSKQNVIEHLLEKDKMPDECDHISSLKDIKNLKLTANPSYSEEEDKNAPFICALIGLEMSGQFRFVALWSCGCVFSERALKELKSNVCNMCQTPYTEQDVIILNGNAEDVALMETRMASRVARLMAEKKDKKSKIKKEVIETVTSETTEKPGTSSISAAKTSIKTSVGIKIEPNTSSSAATSSRTLSKTSIIANPMNQQNKRALISDKISHDPEFKKSKKDYEVSKDPKATEIYKSLFTSHESETNQERAHWVTYNPFYN